MKKIYALFYTLCICVPMFAQQIPQSSLYMLNKFAYNPAYAGIENTLVATGDYRTQWLGLEGNPVTQSVNVHLPLNIISSGFGISLESDATGASKSSSAMVAYNYQLQINRKSLLSLGVAGGIVQRGLDGALLRTPDGSYDDAIPFTHNDELLSQSAVRATTATLQVGVYYFSEKIEAGIGIFNAHEPKVRFSAFDFTLDRTYFVSLQYNLDFGRKWRLQPSVLLKTNEVQMQAEVSALLQYNGNIFVGASYRGYDTTTTDAVVLLAGFKANENWTIAYAYDLTLSQLQNVSTGSHEIMLTYNLGKPIGKGIPPKIIYNPRY